jgi:S-adenosylmethionine hydrolase
LTNPAYQHDTISATFHGRDVFAPAAAHLANGVALHALGEPVFQPQQLELPQPQQTDAAITGEVLLIDHFGNLITNITTQHLEAMGVMQSRAQVAIDVGRSRVATFGRTFSDVAVGEAVAYPGSSGRLEIAVRNDSAAEQLPAQRGNVVTLKKT